VVLDRYAGYRFVVISSVVATMGPSTCRRNVELEDQQQRSERGTTRAGVLLAVVDVVGLMVVLIRIGYVARGFAEQERGAHGGDRDRGGFRGSVACRRGPRSELRRVSPPTMYWRL
jgi:hypothetical protein